MEIPDRQPHNTRAAREIRHGQWLAEQETDVVWGWGTPAGRHRAQRRAELILQASLKRMKQLLKRCFPVVSVTALRDDPGGIAGSVHIGARIPA
jgi:hypothetical protein